ncbi:helix-turn-helix transcriptional regulator [Halorussus halobius]|uniref:helix-turn-helix transcriptional regulator n=1 Tax=Halorussus halobius TaxID=1710537 RepID=UPI001091EF8D|nr:helix-turn-helix domain-containing protein [Halorussus halobius]
MMTTESDGRTAAETAERLPSSAVESVAFLARSEHRVHVLALLNDRPRTRNELSDAVGVTRVTLSRILRDLEDREWITRRGSENRYAPTTFGELVYRDVDRLLATVSVGQDYPGIVERLPTEWFGFDVRCLADGELVGDESSDPLAGARIVANAVRDASSFRSLLGTFISLPMYSFEETVRSGTEPDATVVFDPSVTETMLEDPTLLDRWREIEATAGSTVYYGTDERVPCSIDLVDDETVFLTVDREREKGFDIIRCTHPEVVEWADETVEQYRASATPLERRAPDEGA